MKILNIILDAIAWIIILDAIAWIIVIAAVGGLLYITYVIYMIAEIFTDIYWWEIAAIIAIVAFVCWRFFRK